MNGPHDNDPLDELRQADPHPPDALPSASLARVHARVYEDIGSMRQAYEPKRGARARLAFGGLVTAVLLVGIVAVGLPKEISPSGAGSSASPGAGATTTPRPIGASPSSITGPGMATCVETYNLGTLAHRSLAFDGTVTAIAADEVTFHVNGAFRGVPGDQITLTATGMTGTAITSAGGPNLTVGGRYLVAGEDHFAWSCGYTQSYDASIAASWATVFGQ